MPNYDWTIFQIDNVFTVREIMTRTRELTFASDLAEATSFSTKFDYDIIPIEDTMNFHSYYDRATGKVKDIKKEDLLASNTGIARLLSCLDRREFYFILELDQVAGFVDRSDLNKLISFLPIFVTSLHSESAIRYYLRQKERELSTSYKNFLLNLFAGISGVMEKDGWNNNFNFQALDDKFNEAKKKGFYTDIFDELEFWQELALYYFLKGKLTSQTDWDRIKDYKEIRNRTMHMKDQLSYSNAKENLAQLLSFLDECKKIIGEVFPQNP